MRAGSDDGPVKRGGRWEYLMEAPDATVSSGTRLAFTRKGVEVFGWFDHMCGTGDTWLVPWDEIDRIRKELEPK